jgi:hypothetical protein
VSHSHRWSSFYVPGDAYRYCACGAIETVSPDGEHGPVPAKEEGFVRRHIERLEKSAEALKKTLGPFTFEIDRPEGTTKAWPGGKSFTYPVDYGFFPKLEGEDGEGLDAFVGDDPHGHLESFQKLKPNKDGKLVADETKYLLGVNDRQRETIYKLYGREINARRVYDTWEAVERSLARFEKEASEPEETPVWEKDVRDAAGVALAGLGARSLAHGAAEDLLGAQRFYHGTGDAAAAAIRRDGLLASMGGNPNGSASLSGVQSYVKNSKGHVHVGTGFLGAQAARGYASLVDAKERNPLLSNEGAMYAYLRGMGPGHKGTVLQGAVPYEWLSSNFSPDPDSGGSSAALKGQVDIGASHISDGAVGLRDLYKNRAPDLLGYVKRNPRRVAHGALMAGGSLAAVYAAYRLAKMIQDRHSSPEQEPVVEAKLGAADAPSNLLGLVGTPQYYLTRAADFRRRHPDLRAPDYYNEYGDRYAHRFESQTRPRLSPAGQAWFDKTKHGLQYAIEQKRLEDPEGFDALERDPKAFHRFAYDTHGPVYLNSGIRKLPLRDLMRVARTPDLKDVINRDGLRLVGQVLNPFNKAASVKEARVPTHVKQYRRALQMLAEGQHDFHGTANLPGVVRTGRVVGGKNDAYHTGGKAYFSRGFPLAEYFDYETSKYNDGGFAFPRVQMDKNKAEIIPGTPATLPVPYVAAWHAPLQQGATVFVTSPAAKVREAASAAQRKFNLRRVDPEAYALAVETLKGNVSPGASQHILKNLEGPYTPVMPAPSISASSVATPPAAPSVYSILNRRNAAIAGGTLATAAALYGGHRWLRSRREKEQEKVADAVEQDPSEQPPKKSWLRRNAAPIAGLTTAAVVAPLLYRYLRKQRLSNDPALRSIQEASGGRFGRILEGRQEAMSAPRRWLDRLIYSGGGDVHYQDNLIEAARKSGKVPQVEGVLLHNAPGKQLAQGASNLIANRDSDAVSSIFDNGNKWQEYNIFEHFAPGSMGKTENVADVLADMGHNLGARNPRERGQQVEAFRKAMSNNGARRRDMLAELQSNLRQRFGDGFLLKDVDAAATGGKFPSDLHNFTDLVNEDSPAAKTLINAIKDPRSVIAQSKLPLAQGSWLDRQFAKLRGLPSTQEVRVHVMNGAVAPDLTVPRFSPTMWLTGRKTMRGADQYARDLLTKLPEELQRGTYAMDVAPLVGGGYKLIESNPGYRSGFLSPGNHPVIGPLLHKQFTGQHSQMVSGLGAGAGAVGGGLTAAAGARYLANRQQPEQESELHGVKQASAFDALNWVPAPFQGRVQSPQEIVYAARSTPALAATQENLRLLQVAQDPYGTGSPTQGVSHHRRHHG